MEITEEEFNFIWTPILGKEDREIEWLLYALKNDDEEEE
jgi:hypothetical protein